MDLKQSDFKEIQKEIYNYCGINLHEGKMTLVKTRVMKRVRKLGLQNFSHYMEYLKEDATGSEFLSLVDVLTTNKTSFFREDQHFDFIKDIVIPEMRGRNVNWWSAGCSTGEEPVSCSIVLQEEKVNPQSVKILATDISREVVQFAKKGVYSNKNTETIPPFIRKRYFQKIGDEGYIIRKEIRDMITYGRLNLKNSWPMSGPFHVIMCRNVMIYFNRKTQQELVSRFYNLLEPGGYLFLGHSESIPDTNRHFENVIPAAYRKK